MELLIAILFWLHVYASPETIDKPEFRDANQAQFVRAQEIIDNVWYHYDADGGVVVDNGVDL